MNRTELVDAIAVKADISKKDADAAVKAFIDVVSDARTFRRRLLPELLPGRKRPAGRHPDEPDGRVHSGGA